MSPIIRDTELRTREEIEARIASIQRQFDAENDKSTGRNGKVRYGDMERKMAKLRKLTERRDTLLKRLKTL